MLAAAAAAVANSAKKPSARPSAASPPSVPPRARAFAAKAARVAMTTTTRTPTHDPRALDREPPVPRSTASRPQRPVVATPTTFGRLGRFTGGDDRARTADRARAPPPSSARRARDDALTPTPSRVARKMSFGARDIPSIPTTAAAAAADPLAPPPRLRVTVADLGKSSEGAVSTPGDEASPPPSTRRSSTDARRAFPFASGNGVGTPNASLVGTPNASMVGTPKAPPPGEKTREKTRPTGTTRRRTGVRQSRRTLSRRRRRRRGIAPRPPRPPPRTPPKSPSIDPCPRFPASPTTATRVTSTPRYRCCAAYVVSRRMRGSRRSRGRRAKRRPCFPR